MQFQGFRLIIYLFLFMCSGVVLGLSANFAKIFLPNIHHDFTIMALVASALTIFVLLLLTQWSQPNIEVPIAFILSILWLALAAFASDMIGPVECFALGGQRTAAKNGDTSARAYCYEMKVIQAFSWAAFIVLLAYFIIVIALTSKATHQGHHYAWSDRIVNLPFFGGNPYPGQGYGYGGQGGQPMYYPQGQGGHTLVVQPHRHGDPTVQVIPSNMG